MTDQEKPVHYFRTFTGPEALCGAAQIDSQQRTLMSQYVTCGACLHALEPDEEVSRMLSEGCTNDAKGVGVSHTLAAPSVSGERLKELDDTIGYHHRVGGQDWLDLRAALNELQRSRLLIGQLSGKLAECAEKLGRCSERAAPIPVAERLPEMDRSRHHSEWVLCWCIGRGWKLARYCWDGDWVTVDFCSVIVTHWLPLPPEVKS